MTAAISLSAVRKVFAGVVALDAVTFDIPDQSFFTLLGPSGCGKTTLLRMIAGFETPTSGEIRVFGQAVAELPPHKRPVNTVFQNYALFPHLTVAENVGFGLQMLGWTKRDMVARTAEMLALVKLEDFAARRPAQLSGGQQQRVALARAMAPRPKVLLLDEPLSALDLKLRQAMRAELKALQRETGITFVFVTHDQEEALTMSDQIAVMSRGQVQQIGAPRDVYDAPATRFVAEFIGETNLLEARVRRSVAGSLLCDVPGGQAWVAGEAAPGTRGVLSVRPERMRFAADGLAGRVTGQVYLGTDVLSTVALADGPEVTVRSQVGQPVPQAGPVHVQIAPGAARLLAEG